MPQQLHPDQRLHIRRAFQGAAETYDSAAVLQREVGRRLLDRLDLIRLTPDRVLDIGAGTGLHTAALRERYRKARVIALDGAAGMLGIARRRGSWLRPLPCIQADAARLPLADHSIDLVFSNMAMHWFGDPLTLFQEFQRVLRPGGLLLFSTVGPDTLRELRESWATVDRYDHVNHFPDMHDVGDAMVGARFGDPVMDMEPFTLTYPSLSSLAADLRGTGSTTVLGARRHGLLGRGAHERLSRAYETLLDNEGTLPATVEVVYGHAWGADVLAQKRDGGAVTVSLDALRGKLRRDR